MRMVCKQTRLEEETAQQRLVRKWSARLFLTVQNMGLLADSSVVPTSAVIAQSSL